MACRSPWSPRWWWPRWPCSCCDPAISGPLRFRWRREPISVRTSSKRPSDFRTGQLWLYGATLLIEGGVLMLLVRRPPDRLRRAGRRRPCWPGRLPPRRSRSRVGLAHAAGERDRAERARDVGLVTQDWLGWAGDVAKSQAIGARASRAGGRRAADRRRCAASAARWWMPGRGRRGRVRGRSSPTPGRSSSTRSSTASSGSRRARRGPTCSTSPREAGVDVGQVYEIDASRRTSAANAYVNGIGHTKRVVLYDNLLKDFTPGRDAARRRPRAGPRALSRRAARPALAR